MLGFHILLVLRLECETLCPKVTPLPHTLHLAIYISLHYGYFSIARELVSHISRENAIVFLNFILHLTKSKRGFDLIKQIYNDFANVGTIFDGINTYTFDVKRINNPVQDLFDVASENIDFLKDQLFSLYRGKTISALSLFDEHQKGGLYCRKHYTEALRRLASEGKVTSVFNDNKHHVVSVLLIKECILSFK